MDHQKAVLLDAYMRTGDLAALVTAYTALKAKESKESNLNTKMGYQGYGYFDSGCAGTGSGGSSHEYGDPLHITGT